jgi:hypothetical protein
MISAPPVGPQRQNPLSLQPCMIEIEIEIEIPLSRDDVIEVVQCQYHRTTLPLFFELFTVLCAMYTRDQAWHLQS